MTRLLATLAVALSLATPAAARQDDARLDDLFSALVATDDGQKAQGIEAEIWAIWMESGNPEIDRLLTTGTEAMAKRRFDDALDAFNAVIAADPDFAEGWNKRATLYYLMGRYRESTADVERTLALEPRHFGALSGMGLIASALGDDKAALGWFERALAVNPHMPVVRLRVKLLRKRLGGEPI